MAQFSPDAFEKIQSFDYAEHSKKLKQTKKLVLFKERNQRRQYRLSVFRMGFVATCSAFLLLLSIFVGQIATFDVVDDGYIGNSIYSANRFYRYVEVDGKMVKQTSFDWSFERLVDKLTNFKSTYDTIDFFGDSKLWAETMNSVSNSDDSSDSEEGTVGGIVVDKETYKKMWFRSFFNGLIKIDDYAKSLKSTTLGKAVATLADLLYYLYSIAVRIIASLVDGFRLVYLVLFGGFA